MAAPHRTRAGEAGCSLGAENQLLEPPRQVHFALPGEKRMDFLWALPALPKVPRRLGDPALTEQEGRLPTTLLSAAQGVDKDRQHPLGPNSPGSLSGIQILSLHPRTHSQKLGVGWASSLF